MGRTLAAFDAELQRLQWLLIGGFPLALGQPCCLNDIVADVTEELAELAAVTDICLSSQIPDADIHVLGHASQLCRLVSNLIANAIQYTPDEDSVLSVWRSEIAML